MDFLSFALQFTDPTWIMMNVNYIDTSPVYASQHVCTVKSNSSFISYGPPGMSMTFMDMCEKMSQGTKRQVEWAGEYTYSHFSRSLISFPALLISLSPFVPSFTSPWICVCHTFLTSPTLSSSMGFSWVLFLCPCGFPFWHPLAAQQHDCCLNLFTASRCDYPLFLTAVTPSVRGGWNPICGQA